MSHKTPFLPWLLLPILGFLLLAAGDPPPLAASAELQAELSAAFFERLQSDAGASSRK